MKFFKNLLNKVKEVVNKVFHKEVEAPQKTMHDIVKWADNPPVDKPATWDSEAFRKALQRAIDAGEDFHGAEDGLLQGDGLKYGRVESYLDLHGYYDEEGDEDDN